MATPTETELPFAHPVFDLIDQHLKPLFEKESHWKAQPWPLISGDDMRILEHYKHQIFNGSREHFFNMLLEKVGVNGKTPIIVDAVEMVTRGHAMVSKHDSNFTDRDLRFFVDLACEYSIRNIAAREERNNISTEYYAHPLSFYTKITANPEKAIKILRGFQRKLRERVSPSDPQTRK